MSVAELMEDSEDTAATFQPQPPGNLTVVVRYEPEAAVVAVAGEIDLLTAPRLTAALDELVRTTTRHIAIDLSETTFIDSAGVHVLVQAHQRGGRHLAVVDRDLRRRAGAAGDRVRPPAGAARGRPEPRRIQAGPRERLSRSA